MYLNIRCDRESEKFSKIFWEINRPQTAPVLCSRDSFCFGVLSDRKCLPTCRTCRDPGSLTSHHAFSSARGTTTANYSDTATALLVQYVLGQLGSLLALLANRPSFVTRQVGPVVGGSLLADRR
jgi:hypothetical protein